MAELTASKTAPRRRTIGPATFVSGLVEELLVEELLEDEDMFGKVVEEEFANQ